MVRIFLISIDAINMYSNEIPRIPLYGCKVSGESRKSRQSQFLTGAA